VDKKQKKCCTVYKALRVIKLQQIQLEGCCSTECCCSSLLTKIVQSDTIPFMLATHKGPYIVEAKQTKDHEPFSTAFFRLEGLKPESCQAILSLLKPLNIHDEIAEDLEDLYRLERTAIKIKVDLCKFCAIKCLDIKLLAKKKVIIEPKC
jgi:hypothetical protein